MKVAIDTNVLVRVIVRDDERQTRIAIAELEQADTVVLSLLVFAEAVWVMTRSYGLPRSVIAEKLRQVTRIANVEYDRSEVEAGLSMLDLGGDFADGVIAFQGRARRAEALISFDRKAVSRLLDLGGSARVAGA